MLPFPQPRVAAQAAVVGDHLWLVGGWNPAAAAVPGADPQSQFLNDVWRLDLRTGTWQEVTPQGESMPRISRWAARACRIRDGRACVRLRELGWVWVGELQ